MIGDGGNINSPSCVFFFRFYHRKLFSTPIFTCGFHGRSSSWNCLLAICSFPVFALVKKSRNRQGNHGDALSFSLAEQLWKHRMRAFLQILWLQATEMIDAIRASFKKGLPNLDWMDDKTRRAAEDKVMLIDLKLANVTLGMPISLLIHVTSISV